MSFFQGLDIICITIVVNPVFLDFVCFLEAFLVGDGDV